MREPQDGIVQRRPEGEDLVGDRLEPVIGDLVGEYPGLAGAIDLGEVSGLDDGAGRRGRDSQTRGGWGRCRLRGLARTGVYYKRQPVRRYGFKGA